MPPISIFEALADPTRCRIVELLRQGPQPVHVLASSFTISRPAISRHLRVLKRAKLITEKKTGRENMYRLHVKRLEPASAWLKAVASVKQAEPTKSMRTEAQANTVRPKTSAPSASQIGFDF
ncbi:ArsR/SmtB family transcription factor [Devosia submarina]|uniref:ArsR/SmtB family transcription factor n=1 Tax=Devosia submarina TaxID=1173082 RepID=UPI000D338D7E|nr:metalloregulator ArsR/SmtB family transcription factor [Devosia submarina]